MKNLNGVSKPSSPAAAETILSFFKDTKMKVSDFDIIATGDLGVIGSNLLIKLLNSENMDISSVHTDCGKLIYDIKRQNTPCGGSGCGCCAAVLNTAFLEPLRDRRIKNMLFVPTGALMSPLTVFQKESIPCTSHLLWLSSERGN